MVKIPCGFWLVLITLAMSLPLAILANPAPTSNDAAKLIASAVSIRKFAGAHVDGVLLTEPEKKGGVYHYRGEFNVAKAGKKISCEDWTFSLEHKNGGWSVGDIVRGRCND
ncbi:MAG: hypothetical protein J0L53_01880 [Spirochaetes bacterium]|nr:hypothetical protein [Spirochaetota bacterium]